MDCEKKVATGGECGRVPKLFGGQCGGVPKLFAPKPNYPLRGQKYFSIEGINFLATLLAIVKVVCPVNAEKAKGNSCNKLFIPLEYAKEGKNHTYHSYTSYQGLQKFSTLESKVQTYSTSDSPICCISWAWVKSSQVKSNTGGLRFLQFYISFAFLFLRSASFFFFFFCPFAFLS